MSISIYDQLILPNESIDTDAGIRKNEAEYIYNFLLDKKIKVSLEIGFGLGFAAAHIISATKSILYSIDYQQNSRFNNIGIKNIEKLNLSAYLRLENGFSHSVLPHLLKQGVNLDFAFIDGGHKFDEIFLDFYYIDLMLNDGGYVLFHDANLKATQLVVSWIRTNKIMYKFIEEEKTHIKNIRECQNMIMFCKNDKEDNRAWDHFKEFYYYHPLFIRDNENEEQNMKPVLFNDKLYLTDMHDIKYLCDTFYTKINTKQVIKFDRTSFNWLECDSDDTYKYELKCKEVLSEVLYDNELYFINKNEIRSLFNTDVVKIKSGQVLKFDKIINCWVECSMDEVKIYEMECSDNYKKIWYDNEIYYINKSDIKFILNTEIIKINTGAILKFDETTNNWAKCNPEEIKIFELACSNNLLKIICNDQTYYINKNEIKSLFNTHVVKINPELILKFDNTNNKWIKCSLEEVKIYNLQQKRDIKK